MKLVDDWKQAWRWWSVRGLAAIAALPFVWPTLPPDIKAFVPVEWQPYIFSAIAIAAIIGRVKDQNL